MTVILELKAVKSKGVSFLISECRDLHSFDEKMGRCHHFRTRMV